MRAPDVWHSDVTWRFEPSMGSILRIVESPQLGGDTLWADMGAAYDLLEERTKEQIEALLGLHDFVRVFGRHLPADKQATLRRLRRTIKAAAPKASESLSYGIVGYKLRRKAVAYFGYWKAHYALYGLGSRVTKAHAAELKPYLQSKGTIQLPADKPLPYALVTKLVKARIAEIEKAG